MKEVMKNLVSRKKLVKQEGAVNELFDVVQLADGQYYKIDSVSAVFNNVSLNVAESGLLHRSRSILFVGDVDLNSESPEVEYILNERMLKGGVSLDVEMTLAINATSGSVSALNNPHTMINRYFGQSELNRVLSNRAQVHLAFWRGDIFEYDLDVEILYSIVTLADSERIALLSRCEC